MIILNELGKNILELKKELCNEYPTLVHKALLDSASKMLETYLIDKETYTYLTNNEISSEELEKIILVDKKFIKSKEEIIKEMNDKAMHYEELLEIKSLSVEIDEDNETYLFKKKFVLSREFFEKYFKIEPNVLESVMETNGFAATYSLLRLPKIISEFLQDKIQKFGLEKTASFVIEGDNSPLENMFGIYIIFKLTLEESYNDTLENECLDYIKETLKGSDEYFESKTSD